MSEQCELNDPAESGVTLLDSFAHPIRDRATLRFLFLLENEPQRLQATIYAHGAKGSDPSFRYLLRSQVAAACAGAEISNRAVRALSLIVNRWKRSTFDDAHFSDFTAQVLSAVAALTIADRLPPDAVDRALAPFNTNFEALSQTATPSPLPSTCANSEARVLKPTEPDYPLIAASQHLTGLFSAKTTLDAEGLVQSVEIVAGPSGEGAAVVALRGATVVAAGSSTFAPVIADCHPVAGTYVFNAEFTEDGY